MNKSEFIQYLEKRLENAMENFYNADSASMKACYNGCLYELDDILKNAKLLEE